ncbi:MAG: hypothetical protein GTN69_02925 [Armatimonadetes bacterium]|nr:hypothetical protein [Armatimonadota bacterium]NIO74851.1 hypothetical protein [Armatimonadota bacterium]NIO95613.1 hypothetical protein [Armatimonadota bacterium]
MSSSRQRSFWSPALALVLLAPAVGELLSSSMPPAEFLNPFGFLLVVVLYGGGAVLIRELTFRWGKGWATLLVLGAAYGIVEEGLLCKSFFDPNWPDLGILGTYGRWAGVNWVWSLFLTIYHATISIATPILLINLIFPEQRSQSWVSRRIFGLLALLLFAEVIFGLLAFGSTPGQPYYPPAILYLLAALLAVILFFVARALPHPLFAPKETRVPRLRWFWLAGFLGIFALFLINMGLPATNVHPLITMLICAALVALVARRLLAMSGNGAAWSDHHRFALAAGALSLFILIAPFQEIDNPDRADNTTGMTLVAIAAVLFLRWVWWKVKAHGEG